MQAVKVPKKEAEQVKKELIKKGVFDEEVKPETSESYAYFPLKRKIETSYEIVDKDLEERKDNPTFEEIVREKIPEIDFSELKTSQDLIGDIAIIEVSEELEPYEHELGEALMEAKPYLKTVLKKGKHTGTYRTQKLDWLAGKKTKETVHIENNVKLKVNVEKVYFSPRLANDRKIIAEQVNPHEKVLVMFSGCAPYPCVIAKNAEAKKVVGVEINPVAHKYGLQNVELNNLENVELHQGDVGEIVPQLKENFDRIVMPAPDNANEYLETAIKKANKETVIHYYDFLPEEDLKRGKRLVEETSQRLDADVKILNIRQAGQISPGKFRTCTEFKII